MVGIGAAWRLIGLAKMATLETACSKGHNGLQSVGSDSNLILVSYSIRLFFRQGGVHLLRSLLVPFTRVMSRGLFVLFGITLSAAPHTTTD
jgi:hypothetical protein